MSEERKFVIQQNTDPDNGPMDGVKAEVLCAVTKFANNKKDIKSQKTHNCRIMSSYETGVFSLSLMESHGMSFHIRLDELVELLKAGANAAKEQAEKEDGDEKQS